MVLTVMYLSVRTVYGAHCYIPDCQDGLWGSLLCTCLSGRSMVLTVIYLTVRTVYGAHCYVPVCQDGLWCSLLCTCLSGRSMGLTRHDENIYYFLPRHRDESCGLCSMIFHHTRRGYYFVRL